MTGGGRKPPLGPPKGAEQTREAILGQRFSTPDTDTPPPTSDADGRASHTPHTRVRSRPEPPGMTRRTYYLPETAADAMEAAVATVRAATGGRMSKHEALAALIAAGAAQAETVAAELREQLLRELSGPDQG